MATNPPAAAGMAPMEGLVERCTLGNWRRPLPGHDSPQDERPIVALGKFDALHRGHMALAAAAANLGGAPLLLSFSGMAEVLGWPQRLPLIAPCDRSRVLALWAREIEAQQAQRLAPGGGGDHGDGLQWPPPESHLQKEQQPSRPQQQQQQQQQRVGANVQLQAGQPGATARAEAALRLPRHGRLCVRQRYVPFSAVRSLSPEAFVVLLAGDLRAAGVVAGINYRFGYRAKGDASLLQRLSAEAGLRCAAVPLVAWPHGGGGAWVTRGDETTDDDGEAPSTVSSSRIRELLGSGCVEGAATLLGRPYRLVAAVCFGSPGQQQQQQQQQPRGAAADVPCPGDAEPKSSGDGGAAAVPLPRVTSTVSMDGTESEAVPLRLRDGGRLALVAPAGLLNAAPGTGRYACRVAIHAGASPSDELLALEAAAGLVPWGDWGGAGSCGAGGDEGVGSGGESSGANSDAGRAAPAEAAAGIGGTLGSSCIVLQGVEVALGGDGLLLPAGPLLRALGAGADAAGPATALVSLDFDKRL